MQENADTLWLRLHSHFASAIAYFSYPLNSTEGQSVILAFTGFCRLMRGVAKENVIFLEF